MYFIWRSHVWTPFKVLSSPAHTLAFPLLGTVLERFFLMAFSSFVAFALISEIVSNPLPLRGFLHKDQGQVSRGGEEQ